MIRSSTLFQKGHSVSEEVRKKISEANKGKTAWNKGLKGYLAKKKHYNYGKHWSSKIKLKMSLSHKGKISPMKGKHHTEEAKRKNREAHFGKKHTEEQKVKNSKTHIRIIKEGKWHPNRNQWVKPNIPEKNLIEILQKYNLPYKYTGNGTFLIDGINPDFVNCNGHKICIEVWGDYWHNLPKQKERDKQKLEVLKKYLFS